jgi:hypothetical protein
MVYFDRENKLERFPFTNCIVVCVTTVAVTNGGLEQTLIIAMDRHSSLLPKASMYGKKFLEPLTKKWRHDIQHKDTQRNDIQHINT